MSKLHLMVASAARMDAEWHLGPLIQCILTQNMATVPWRKQRGRELDACEPADCRSSQAHCIATTQLELDLDLDACTLISL